MCFNNFALAGSGTDTVYVLKFGFLSIEKKTEHAVTNESISLSLIMSAVYARYKNCVKAQISLK